MPRHTPPNQALSMRFARLMQEMEADCGDVPAMTDETGYFHLVDAIAEDADADPECLEEAGRKFAEHFVCPYLHAEEPPMLIGEVAALIAIHHRGQLKLQELEETADGWTLQVTFVRLAHDGRERPPTRFDTAVLRRALADRFPFVEVERVEGTQGPTTLRLRLRRPVVRHA